MLLAGVGFSSVGVGVESVVCSGISSMRLSCAAMSNSALRTGSPARKLGTVFFGGCVNIVMMSSAACFR